MTNTRKSKPDPYVRKSALKLVHKKLDGITYRLDNVRVNGRKGLQEALIDIFTDLHEMKEKENTKWYNRTIGQILSSKHFLMKLFWIAVVLIITLLILQAFGVDIDIASLGRLFHITI